MSQKKSFLPRKYFFNFFFTILEYLFIFPPFFGPVIGHMHLSPSHQLSCCSSAQKIATETSRTNYVYVYVENSYSIKALNASKRIIKYFLEMQTSVQRMWRVLLLLISLLCQQNFPLLPTQSKTAFLVYLFVYFQGLI